MLEAIRKHAQGWLAKAILAFASGGARYGSQVTAGLLGMMLAAAVAMAL